MGNNLIQKDLDILQFLNNKRKYSKISQKEKLDYGEGYVIKNGRIIEIEIRLDEEDKDTCKDKIFSLDALETLILTDYNSKSIGKNIKDLKNLKKLKVSGKIEIIPEEISQLKNLEEINLSSNIIKTIPEGFLCLSSLKKIDFSNNQISSLPSDFGKLTRLEELKIYNNHLESLPPSFSNLKQLKYLDLSRNKIQQLSNEFGSLLKLKKVNLSNNEISSLPKLVGLKEMRILNCMNNNITSIPKSIGELMLLEELDFCHNKLSTLPESLGSLGRLEKLALDGNLLGELPISLKNLKKLRSFSIMSNPDLKLPAYLAEFFKNNDSFYLHLPDQVKAIPPSFLLSQDIRLFKKIYSIFNNSIPYLENYEDYKEVYLDGVKGLEPYILKLAEHKYKDFEPYYIINEDPTGLEELYNKLMDAVRERKERKRLKILFIELVESSGSRVYPMGILLLSAYLKQNNFTSISYIPFMCDVRVESPKYRQFTDSIKEIDPHMIFIGPVVTPNVKELPSLVNEIRDWFPNTPLFAGGPHFGKNQNLDDQLLETCRGIDGFIIGEGEMPVVNLCNTFHYLWTKYKYIPKRNEYIRRFNSVLGVKTHNSLFIPSNEFDLADLPHPDYDLLWNYLKKISKYPTQERIDYKLSQRRNPYIGEVGFVVDDAYGGGGGFDSLYYFNVYDTYNSSESLPFAIIVGSRNCPFNCSFCCSHGERKLHTPQYIFNQMIDNYQRFNTTLFVFFDPLFTSAAPIEQKRINQFCDLLLDSNHSFQYLIEIRVDVILKLPDQLIKKMIQSGCIEFNLGLEKGNDEALHRLMKHTTIKDQIEAVKKLRNISKKVEKPVLINGTFILGGPKETKKDLIDTIYHGFSLDLDNVIFFPLEIHPGTDIYKKALQEGLISESIEIYLDQRPYPLFTSEKFSRTFLTTLKYHLQSIIKIKHEINSIIWEQDFIKRKAWREKLLKFQEIMFSKILDDENQEIIIEQEAKPPQFKDEKDLKLSSLYYSRQYDLNEENRIILDNMFDNIEKEIVKKYYEDNFSPFYHFSLKSHLVDLIKELIKIIRFINET